MADVHAAGVIMLAGSELVMTGLAVLLAATLVRARGGGRPAGSVPGEYSAGLASLESKASGRVHGPAPSGHDR